VGEGILGNVLHVAGGGGMLGGRGDRAVGRSAARGALRDSIGTVRE